MYWNILSVANECHSKALRLIIISSMPNAQKNRSSTINLNISYTFCYYKLSGKLIYCSLLKNHVSWISYWTSTLFSSMSSFFRLLGVYEYEHKVTQVSLLLSFSYTKSGARRLETNFLACLTRMDGSRLPYIANLGFRIACPMRQPKLDP